jgi:hypothetical protein
MRFIPAANFGFYGYYYFTEVSNSASCRRF